MPLVRCALHMSPAVLASDACSIVHDPHVQIVQSRRFTRLFHVYAASDVLTGPISESTCLATHLRAICIKQVLGENALLARVLLEGVGVFARALGARCRADGRLMYTVLIPALERMADPCPSVSAAAAAAIGSLCVHGGYSTFNELVSLLLLPLSAHFGPAGKHGSVPWLHLLCGRYGLSKSAESVNLGTAALQVRGNADYIVDGLCRQLRHLENHPRCCTPSVLLKAIFKSKSVHAGGLCKAGATIITTPYHERSSAFLPLRHTAGNVQVIRHSRLCRQNQPLWLQRAS